MLASVALAILAATRIVFAGPVDTPTPNSICGSEISQQQLRSDEEQFGIHNLSGDFSKAAAATINVNWHVISQDNTVSGGNIPDSQINDQIAVLNQDYASAGLSWRLAGVDRTINSRWFNSISPYGVDQDAMKQALYKGRVADLNVYSVGSISNSLLGYSTFPWQYQGKPWDDGIVIRTSVLPEGSLAGYNSGKILTHEVGHWVGLLHTFQDGCNGGDYVDDTPAEASPSSGCPEGRDTCSAPGLDPIHNHMDYSDDGCRNHFTPGQVDRLRTAIAQFRGISR